MIVHGVNSSVRNIVCEAYHNVLRFQLLDDIAVKRE